MKTPTVAFSCLQPGSARTVQKIDFHTLNIDLIWSDRAHNGLVLSGRIAGGTVIAAASVDEVLIIPLTAAGKEQELARRLICTFDGSHHPGARL